MTLVFTLCQALPKRIPGHFDYSTLKAYISKTTKDRNKRIRNPDILKSLNS